MKQSVKGHSKMDSKQTSKQVKKQASKLASKQASKQASKPASKQASKPASKQASKSLAKKSSKQPSKPASAKIVLKSDSKGALGKKLSNKSEAVKGSGKNSATADIKGHKTPVSSKVGEAKEFPVKGSGLKKGPQKQEPIHSSGKATPVAAKVVVEKTPKGPKEAIQKSTSGVKATEIELSKAKALAEKVAAAKKGKPKKTEEVDLEDDFIPEDDFGTSEIGEYEEELKAVETLDEEVDADIDWSTDSKSASDDDIYLTDADGNRYCRAKDCDQLAAVDAYCRFHYLLFWKRIQVRNKILADGKFAKYVEELTARYPDKFLEMIRRDLRTHKDFLSAIQELEIDESESNSEGEEETQSFTDEVRGLGESSSMEDEEF